MSLYCGLIGHVEQWSKSTYTYGAAVCLLQIDEEKHAQDAAALMTKVPTLRQRIAGKSIPLEVSSPCRTARPPFPAHPPP